jgi:hypothetical protein
MSSTTAGSSLPRAVSRRRLTCLTTANWKAEPMRTMFYLYLGLIVTGIVFSSIVGLTHN